MSFSHAYQRFGNNDAEQAAYIAEYEAAEAAQRVPLAVAPRCRLFTPLGRLIPAGAAVSVDDFAGGDDLPIAILKRAYLEGKVIKVRNDLNFDDDPAIKRKATVTIDNSKVVVDPEGGWQPTAVHRMSDHVRADWLGQCEAIRREAKAPLVVAPWSNLKLRDGSYLRVGDPVLTSNFRYSDECGLPQHQLQRLVELNLVVETYWHEQPGDGPQAA